MPPNANNDGGAAVVMMSCMIMSMCYSMCSSGSAMLSVLGGGNSVSYTGMDDVWGSMTKGTKVKPGKWTSKTYGNMDKPMRGQCPEGAYLTDVMAFYGQGEHTNALQGWCYNPTTKKVNRLFDAPTCGKRDRPKASNVFLDGLNAIMIGIGAVIAVIPGFHGIGAALVAGGAGGLAIQGAGLADAKENLLKGGYGRAVYDYKFLASPAGIYKWKVRPKDDEIQGLNMYGLQGQELGWAGGNSGKTFGRKGPRSTDPSGTIHTGSCPKGKIVTGIEASCGDRVDGLRFTCDVPPSL